MELPAYLYSSSVDSYTVYNCLCCRNNLGYLLACLLNKSLYVLLCLGDGRRRPSGLLSSAMLHHVTR